MRKVKILLSGIACIFLFYIGIASAQSATLCASEKIDLAGCPGTIPCADAQAALTACENTTSTSTPPTTTSQASTATYEICLNTSFYPSECQPGTSVFYGRSCDQCCNGETYGSYSIGGLNHAQSCCLGIPYNKNNSAETDSAKFNTCCESPDTPLIDMSTKSIACCPEGTTELYGQYGHDKCCIGERYGFSKANDDTLTIYNCCESPNKLYKEAAVTAQESKIGTVISDGELATIEKYEQVCVSCQTCEDLYNNVINTLNELGGTTTATRPTSASPVEIKAYYEKYNENHCEIFQQKFNCGSTTTTPSATSSDVGIECTKDQMIYGQCKFNVYDTLGIRQGDKETSVGIFVQDIILSATMFIGTIVTIAIIIAGLLFVFGGADPSLQDKAKKGLINAIIGLVIVMSSYAIIRLVQFIVKGE